MVDQNKRAAQARFKLLKHLVNMHRLMSRAGNLALEHPQALKELQIILGTVANKAQELRDISARLDGSEPVNLDTKRDPWEGRKYIHYNTGKKWVPATIKKYDAKAERLTIVIDDTRQRKTISSLSTLIR